MKNNARCRSVAVGISALFLLGKIGRAEEIAPFKLTGIDGYTNLQYASDEQTTGAGGTRSHQAQSGWRNEIFVMTHSYIYHPNLVTLDIGGGPVLHSENFADDASDTKARGALYNFSARANFLHDKPYTGDLFYSHLNPTVSVAPGEVLTQENTRYGADFSLRAPVTQVPLQAGFLHTQSLGHGAERKIDDTTDQFNLGASRSFGSLGSTQVQFQSSQQASKSGSQNLPIQASTSRNQAINVDTRLQLGATQQYDLTNVISINSQKYTLEANPLPDLTNTRVLLDLRARNSSQLNTYGSYNYNHNSQGDIDSVTQSGSAGLSYWPVKGLEAGLDVRGENNESRQFSTRAQGIDGSIRYQQSLPVGVAQASYGLRYDNRSQQAMSPQTQVLGEQVTLSGIAYVVLGHPNVIAGSPVVSDATRTQTYVAGLDYLLTVVGTQTRLQRLIGGNILDGQALLVDYAYDVGGTYTYHELGQTLNFDWNLSNYISAYSRYFSATPRLDSGSPTFPLNEIRSRVFGMRADMPVNAGLAISVGGSMEFENRRETISPYRRYANDFYLQTDEPLFELGYFRASVRRTRVEYDDATQNSDLHGYELRYWARPWFGMNLTAALGSERDDAGLIPRRRVDGSLGLQWQVRKFSLTSSLVRTRESQGDAERNRTIFQFLARRDF